jgi:lysyl-tRNA synthetase class 1
MKYGWLFFRGKKFSKSLGVGIRISEILKIMPPEIVKYYLLRPDIQENKDFDPSGYKLLSIYEDYEYASQLEQKEGKLSRADQKKYLTYKLSGRRRWKARFTDFLLYYQIFKDWNKVGEMLGDMEGVQYLSKYIENWIKSDLHPEEYDFELSPRRPPKPEYVEKFVEGLKEEMSDLDIHNLVYSTAKELGVSPQEIFKNIYIALFGKEKGPRVGRLIKAIGVKKFKEMLIL